MSEASLYEWWRVRSFCKFRTVYQRLLPEFNNPSHYNAYFVVVWTNLRKKKFELHMDVFVMRLI